MKLKESQKLYFCPHCQKKDFKKIGFYYRKISKTYIPRYLCHSCHKSFSTRTTSFTKNQKRPDLNLRVYQYLTSGVALREITRLLQCNYKTVYRKFLWLSKRAFEHHQTQEFLIQELQFDEMQSIEHTKLKPLTIALAVSEDYQILGVKVGTLPAQGLLSQISLQKYGPRAHESEKVTKEMLLSLQVKPKGPSFQLKSDQKPLYRSLVQKHFAHHPYATYISRGNRKLKEMRYLNQEKKVFDPLFQLNQRCAKLRDHIKRLSRRNWCTTKIKENLERHLYLYVAKNNGYQII